MSLHPEDYQSNYNLENIGKLLDIYGKRDPNQEIKTKEGVSVDVIANTFHSLSKRKDLLDTLRNNYKYYDPLMKAYSDINSNLSLILGLIIASLCGLYISVYDIITDTNKKQISSLSHLFITMFCQGFACIIFTFFIVYMIRNDVLVLLDDSNELVNNPWTYYFIAFVCGWLTRKVLDAIKSKVGKKVENQSA